MPVEQPWPGLERRRCCYPCWGPGKSLIVPVISQGMALVISKEKTPRRQCNTAVFQLQVCDSLSHACHSIPAPESRGLSGDSAFSPPHPGPPGGEEKSMPCGSEPALVTLCLVWARPPLKGCTRYVHLIPATAP